MFDPADVPDHTCYEDSDEPTPGCTAYYCRLRLAELEAAR